MTNDKTIETGGPAFPIEQHDLDGMTLRQYAAIKLKVPGSGTDWLDKMIMASIRDDFAAKALATIPATNSQDIETWKIKDYAIHAFAIAEAMLLTRPRN